MNEKELLENLKWQRSAEPEKSQIGDVLAIIGVIIVQTSFYIFCIVLALKIVF